jgi:DNA-3-methyladenine glycosylase
MPLISDFFDRPVAQVAEDLVGCSLRVAGVGGRIVETEAYAADDPASHSFRGPTPRNAAMFGPAGHAYVYRVYGLHWCLNLTCGHGSAVLIRAIEPLWGVDAMVARRGPVRTERLCSGPANLCRALAVDGDLDQRPLASPPFDLSRGEGRGVVAMPRIGISRATETPWRFAEPGSPALSRPYRLPGGAPPGS